VSAERDSAKRELEQVRVDLQRKIADEETAIKQQEELKRKNDQEMERLQSSIRESRAQSVSVQKQSETEKEALRKKVVQLEDSVAAGREEKGKLQKALTDQEQVYAQRVKELQTEIERSNAGPPPPPQAPEYNPTAHGPQPRSLPKGMSTRDQTTFSAPVTIVDIMFKSLQQKFSNARPEADSEIEDLDEVDTSNQEWK